MTRTLGSDVGIVLAFAALAWAAGGPAAVAAPPAASQDAAATDEARLQQLEADLARLRVEIAALEAQAGSGSGGPSAESIAELKKRVEALTQEVARLRGDEAPAAADAGRSYGGLDARASKVYFVTKGIALGGYGSALYQRYTKSADDDTPANIPNTISLTEAFLYVGYRYNDRFVFNSSLGIEDALVEDGAAGSATVEFAYVDYSAGKSFGARGGLLLMPLGFLNEKHEPGSWLGARRPEVELRIIPTTWREVGAGVYGVAGRVQWRGYLITSLNAPGFVPQSGVAGGRQQGAGARADDFGWTARLDWTALDRKKTGDLLLGASAFTGRTGQGNPGFPEGRFTMWEAHADYRFKGLRARALFVQGIQSDAGEISLAIDPSGATAVGERMVGWYAELGYNVMGLTRWNRQELTPFCRYESLNTQDKVAPGMTADPANDLTVKTCGVQYQPIPGVLVKFDTQNFDQQAHTGVDQYNLGLGWAF